jgi:hypothetical protein
LRKGTLTPRSPQELEARFRVFRDNYAYVEEYNARSSSHKARYAGPLQGCCAGVTSGLADTRPVLPRPHRSCP